MPLITTELLRRLPSEDRDISDTRLPGFLIRCRRSGTHSYLARIGRGRYATLGKVSVLSLSQARDEARKVLGRAAVGDMPGTQRAASLTLEAFLEDIYTPWVTQHRRTGAEIVDRIRASFSDLLSARLADLSTFSLERWRSQRRKAGAAPATINRDVNDLRAALARAVEWRHIKAHPFASLRPLKVDASGVVRYLSSDESKRLARALVARDDARRAERESANRWRQERGHPPYAEFGPYTDHLHPLVVLALHTGLRRGELFALRWVDVDLEAGRLVVRGSTAKSGQTRYVELNSEAVRVLTTWQASSSTCLSEAAQASGLVFPSASGDTLDNVQSAWEALLKDATITGFRFHDLRHTFASRLVMAGVDLNTVRELLGHANLTMTLRYAHLSPGHRRAAVEQLVAHTGA